MRKNEKGDLKFSPSDLIRYMASPFASWMDRYYLEYPGAIVPDEQSEQEKLIADTGRAHERAVLAEFMRVDDRVVDLSDARGDDPYTATICAIDAGAPLIYQAPLTSDSFSGFADFLILAKDDQYEVWDAKLARSTKPYFAIELCCYTDMLTEMTGGRASGHFGVILGTTERKRLRVEDFIHYYRRLERSFLALQNGFTGTLADRPEPLPRADHGRWSSHAVDYFLDSDHLVRVAGITTGQIRKLTKAGINTLSMLAGTSEAHVPKLANETLAQLVAQARLQRLTLSDREVDPDAPPRVELKSQSGPNGEPTGLAALPPPDAADVFFDMEGYPLYPGGLEYLFGASIRASDPAHLDFIDFWAHDRAEEKRAFESFVDWVHARWRANPGMHIYHYAPYEVSAVRRLSTLHDSRQDEVDDMLRRGVFVDLYHIVRQGLRVGEESYSIKKVEHLYRKRRSTDVATAGDSIVQYAHWIESGESRSWTESPLLNSIREYNRDDCESTVGLLDWLTTLATKNNIVAPPSVEEVEVKPEHELPTEVVARMEIAAELRSRDDDVSKTLADLIGFHRREEKPVWWKMFDRAEAGDDTLRDDPGCIQGVEATGAPEAVKRSYAQRYRFDPAQECRLIPRDDSRVMFTNDLRTKFNLVMLDTAGGMLELKLSGRRLAGNLDGEFPSVGSLIPYEQVDSGRIQSALTDVIAQHLDDALHPSVRALLERRAPTDCIRRDDESVVDAAVRVAGTLEGGCFVIQGPPGTGKTYTASAVITALVARGNTVGVASNSHKAVSNLLAASCRTARASGAAMHGIKVGGDSNDPLFEECPEIVYADSGEAHVIYSGGVVGGTAWLFTREEWDGALDYLFIDEAGQVSLANTVAMARCARNLVLLGDQMQLEQPVQGSHPGLAGLSGLQYALLDTVASLPDAPLFHAVIPLSYGLFLGESRRMHPDVCAFISDSIYEGRLRSHPDCSNQRIEIERRGSRHVTRTSGVVFSGVEHEGNTQQSDEEVDRVLEIYRELVGARYTDKNAATRQLTTSDLLFIAPYNAQVRALKEKLPPEARVGSVDRFQGQEAPVCILSLCSSYAEYGSRGLGFILDRNRLNVAISRAQCLAVVVADPRIAVTPIGSIEEMSLVNLLCKVAEIGSG